MNARRLTHLAASVLIGVALALSACSSGSRVTNPYTPMQSAARDTARAEQLNRKAADLLDSDPTQAEQLLREALSADLYHGPAHNNLGVLYLSQGLLYEAAGEFEWARKLLPGHPDPRLNLALTLERAGRVDEALAAYDAALDVYPGHIQTMQALARLQLRTSRPDNRTAALLDEIALRGQSEQWREWAIEQRRRDPNAQDPTDLSR